MTAQQDIHLVLQRKADLELYQNQIIGTTPGENNGRVIDVPGNYEIWTGEVHQGAIVIGSGEWQRALNGEFTGLSAGQHILRAGESVNEATHTFYFASDYADFFVPRGLWKVAVDVSASAHVSFPQGTELTAEPGVDLFLYAEPEDGFRISSYSVDKPGRIGGLAYDEDNGYFIIQGVSGNVLLTVIAEPVEEKPTEEPTEEPIEEPIEEPAENPTEEPAAEYVFLEGGDSVWLKGSGSALRFRINGAYDDFTGIRIDGETVSESNYNSEPGSTIIMLKPDYLETLPLDNHTLTVDFKHGSGQTEFTVTQSKSEGNFPATGEPDSMAAAWTVLLLSIAVLLAITFRQNGAAILRRFILN